MFPAISIILGKRSEKEIGTLDSTPALIFGPEIINGIRIPPSKASHFPLLNGVLEPLRYCFLGGIIGTAPLSEVYIIYVSFSRSRAFTLSNSNPTPESKSSVMAANPA